MRKTLFFIVKALELTKFLNLRISIAVLDKRRVFMDLSKKNRRMKETLRNISSDIGSRVLSILKSEGSTVIGSEQLKKRDHKQVRLEQIRINKGDIA